MQWLWCWRCKQNVPMLDEAEYAEIASLPRAGLSATKEAHAATGGSTTEARAGRFAPMLDRYEAITGFKETNPNAVMHHRLAQYGPPCHHCGKPLRTPQAKLCGSCMTPRQPE